MLKRRGVYVNEAEVSPSTTLTSSRGSFGRTNRKRTHFPQKVLLQPVGKNVPKLEVIEKYRQWQQALDVLYRVPGQPAEQRRITPLSIEKRGEHTYVIAYCQTRRAQRTFRLDRMEVPGTF
jgi:predicted DNA-binding transcriptional regulator YafY